MERPEGKRQLGDQGVDGRIYNTCKTDRKEIGCVWTRFIWLRLVSSGAPIWTR